MASPTAERGCFSDVRKVGYLRKPKSMHKRFFVLRIASVSGPSRLEYYENEKKWRHKSGAPKRSIPLENCFNINKRADSKNKYLVALYTKDEYFAIAADSEQEQDMWFQALVDLHNRGKIHETSGGKGESYGEINPGPAFKEVWQVILKPKGLGQLKNLIGIYRLCLTSKTISFVKLNSDAAAVVLQLMNIRRCGHSENFFFIEVGRSAVTGPGEFWMQVDDSVVAQNMHETILEAMKAMSEEFRPRSKSQSSSNCSNPISVPLRRHHHSNPPPSQVGLGRRSRAESVTASSPAGPGRHSHSFRVRASSDGEGTMSRPASVDGSPITNRTHSHRHRGGSRLHPPLNHSRSIPMPSRCSPSAISPVSLSSSSTSGHGSTSDCLYPRRSSASISGSPSDGGFISSDEYGSSPCDFRGSFRSVTPDSLGHTPPAREEELSNYICMAPPGPLSNGFGGRTIPGCTPPCLEEVEPEPELEHGFRARTHSSGSSPSSTVCQSNPPQSSSTASYTVMMPAYQCLKSNRQSAFMTANLSSYPEESVELPQESTNVGHKDDGYMPMSPGVAPMPCKMDDYMPMSPKSVSAPQQIINPRPHSQMDSNGYMMMSPSESVSPDTTYSKIWTNGANPKLSLESSEGKVSYGDYINMSPASCSTTSTPPDCYFNPVDEAPKPLHSYFSLPRSFRHGQRKHEPNPLRLSVSSGRLVHEDSSSSSTSSDSLGGHVGGQLAVKPKKSDSSSRLTRPTRLSLDGHKASTLPRARDNPFPPEPKSPGEYVNIEFNDKSFSSSLACLFSPVSLAGSSERLICQPSEYVNMELSFPDRKPNGTSKLLASEEYAMVAPAVHSVVDEESRPSCDYVSMQLGPCPVRQSEVATMLNYAELPQPPSSSLSPKQESVTMNGCSGLMNTMSGLSAFTRVSSSQGTRVIRVDPQGRRRHSSETFSSPAVGGASGISATLTMEDVKRHSSASFENVWMKPSEQEGNDRSTQADGEPLVPNGVNYIDLDLVKEQNHSEWGSLQAKPLNLPSSSNTDDLSLYACITFQKHDEVRRNQVHKEE